MSVKSRGVSIKTVLLSWEDLSMMNLLKKNCGQIRYKHDNSKRLGERHKKLGRFCRQIAFQLTLGFFSSLKKLNLKIIADSWFIQERQLGIPDSGPIFKDEALFLCQVCE